MFVYIFCMRRVCFEIFALSFYVTKQCTSHVQRFIMVTLTADRSLVFISHVHFYGIRFTFYTPFYDTEGKSANVPIDFTDAVYY